MFYVEQRNDILFIANKTMCKMKNNTCVALTINSERDALEIRERESKRVRERGGVMISV